MTHAQLARNAWNQSMKLRTFHEYMERRCKSTKKSKGETVYIFHDGSRLTPLPSDLSHNK